MTRSALGTAGQSGGNDRDPQLTLGESIVHHGAEDDVRFFVDLINSGEESEALDEAVLSIVGPASAELTLLDHELVLAPQDQRSVAVTVGVSCVAPAGVYECTLEIRNDGESLTSESFETEVLP